MVLLVEDEDEGKEGTKAEAEAPCIELSAFFAGGLSQPKTLKLQGKVGERDI